MADRAGGKLDGEQDGAVGRLLRQWRALAEFGSRALAETDLDRVLTEGARLCAEGLGVPLCKVTEHRPGPGDLIVRAGVGWNPGVVGRSIARADAGSPAGRAFITGRPTIFADLRAAGEGLDLPALYPEHGIVSTANVLVGGGPGEPPYGVLEVDAPERRDFGPLDLDFLQGYANVMANAVRALRRGAALAAESDARAVLLREQQHRIRNNLMAVAAMLRDGERNATTEDSRGRFGAVRRRVFALASLHDHLLGAGLPGGGAADLRDYLDTLCRGARDFHDLPARGIDLAFAAEEGGAPAALGLDACTGVGIVVNELVANAVEHAFGATGGGGRIAVRLGGDGRGGRAVSVEDDGSGVPPGAEGRSVGLGVARRLVERIGGSLSLATEPGRTVWTVALPGGGGAAER